MRMTYQVISKSPEVILKFFYEPKDGYGEFYIRLTRCSKDANLPESPIGVHGSAEVQMKDPDYAKDLLQGLAKVLKGVKKHDR